MELYEMSAVEASQRIRSGEISVEELTRSCISRIRQRDQELNAWTQIDEDLALHKAKELDHEEPRSPVHGIPVGVKDVIDTVDFTTARGSKIYSGRHPRRDAAIVQALKDAGALVLGKTVTTEFAASTPGPTRNPLDLTRTPGGSSSGSAAAVADHMVPFALGTQTSGSVIRPASFCGIVGMKPTYGTWPTRGVQELAPSLDTLGAFARTIEDVKLFWPHLGGSVVNHRASSGEPRVRFAETPFWHRITEGARERLNNAVESAMSRGFVLDKIELPHGFEKLENVQLGIFAYEAYRSLELEYHHHKDQLSPFLQGWLAKGAAISNREYSDHRLTRLKVAAQMDDLWKTTDVLMVPAVVDVAPEGITDTGDPLLCRPWTTLGLPSVTVPIEDTTSALPLGIQFVGPPGEDSTVLKAAESYIAALSKVTQG